jgi:hypothetical protein
MHALTHFAARHGQRNAAIGANGDPAIERKRAFDGQRLRRLQALTRRQHAPANQQSASDAQAAEQEPAPAPGMDLSLSFDFRHGGFLVKHRVRCRDGCSDTLSPESAASSQARQGPQRAAGKDTSKNRPALLSSLTIFGNINTTGT